jgi:hypothetical protein
VDHPGHARHAFLTIAAAAEQARRPAPVDQIQPARNEIAGLFKTWNYQRQAVKKITKSELAHHMSFDFRDFAASSDWVRNMGRHSL